MFNPTRDQARQFFFAAWKKFREQAPLSDLEALAVEHIGRHPEYQAILDAPERNQAREWRPELGETNPFLHLSMHLAISEQLSIDQPIGIKPRFEKLRNALGDEHDAQHQVMDCLAEMIWTAQRYQQAPDGAAYLACLEKKCPG
jgi:hypothetical protein